MFQLNAAVSGRFLTLKKFYMYAKVILFQYIINNPHLQASFNCFLFLAKQLIKIYCAGLSIISIFYTDELFC